MLQRRTRPPRSAGEQECAGSPAWRCIWPELAGWRPAGSPSSAAAARCWLARQTDTRYGSTPAPGVCGVDVRCLHCRQHAVYCRQHAATSPYLLLDCQPWSHNMATCYRTLLARASLQQPLLLQRHAAASRVIVRASGSDALSKPESLVKGDVGEPAKAQGLSAPDQDLSTANGAGTVRSCPALAFLVTPLYCGHTSLSLCPQRSTDCQQQAVNWCSSPLKVRAQHTISSEPSVSSQATTEYATMSEDPAGYPRAFVVKRLITFVGIVIG